MGLSPNCSKAKKLPVDPLLGAWHDKGVTGSFSEYWFVSRKKVAVHLYEVNSSWSCCFFNLSIVPPFDFKVKLFKMLLRGIHGDPYSVVLNMSRQNLEQKY